MVKAVRTKSKTPTKNPSPSWIAEREYTRRDVPGRVVARVGCPEPDPESTDGDWRCLIQIEGLDLTQIEDLRLDKDAPLFAHGLDSMDALQNGLRSIHTLLKRHRTPLRWERTKTNELGFPVQVPTGHGIAFDRRMEKVIEAIDAAIQGRVQRLRKRYERHEARRKARTKPRSE